MIRNSLLLLVFILFADANLKAQEIKDTLSWKSFIAIVKQNHPVTVKAKLVGQLAKAIKKQAWGGFDPKFETEFDRKIYDGTEYYSFLTPQIKLPLWYGIELKGSYSEAEGTFLNPESKLPKEGLSYAGINFQLGKGLLMDNRRATFKKAVIFESASENEQNRILNDLFFDAGENYINWKNKYANVKILENALNLSEVRYEAVKLGFLNGDKPAIDTLEAQIQVQQRKVFFEQAKLELKQAQLELSTFLWLENQIPIDAAKLNVAPDEFDLPVTPIPDLINNPKLLSFDFKIQDLNIERRLKAESLKPELNITLGLLNQGKTLLRNINSNYWNQNNKVNVSFAFPITFTKARGDIAAAKIKILDTELDKKLTENELKNKFEKNIAELNALQNQLNILQTTLKFSEQLLKGEETKFRFGDSSLFLINSRESKLIEVQEKLFLVEAKLKKAQLKTLWLNGSLLENLN
ncbi:MAG: TolC family protein [Pelobium sp.]